jgi:hypothetical protein
VTQQREEGWYTDPYRLHEARWFSDGEPTKLVRDGAEESYDPPPITAPLDKPERCAAETASHGEDLHRADDQRAGFDRQSLTDAAGNAFDQAVHG